MAVASHQSQAAQHSAGSLKTWKTGFRLLALGYWLSAIGYWLLAIGYRLSAIGQRGTVRAWVFPDL
jgi:hypothetical protein